MRLARSESHVCCASGSFGAQRCKRTADKRFFGTPLVLGNKKQGLQRRSPRTVGRIHCLTDIFETNFKEEVLQSEVPVLIDFWATWCGPCKLMEPTMAWLEEEYDGRLRVVKLETPKSPNITEKYKIYGLPTIMLFRDGKMVEKSHREGALSRQDVIEYLEEFGIVPDRTASS